MIVLFVMLLYILLIGGGTYLVLKNNDKKTSEHTHAPSTAHTHAPHTHSPHTHAPLGVSPPPTIDEIAEKAWYIFSNYLPEAMTGPTTFTLDTLKEMLVAQQHPHSKRIIQFFREALMYNWTDLEIISSMMNELFEMPASDHPDHAFVTAIKARLGACVSAPDNKATCPAIPTSTQPSQ